MAKSSGLSKGLVVVLRVKVLVLTVTGLDAGLTVDFDLFSFLMRPF